MPDYAGEYLTTKELADLLRIKERKVYELAAQSDIPCTRALGKLLFPRVAIDAWLARHASGASGTRAAIPTVFLGSHDPLLDWSLRESHSGIASYFDGSLDGLRRFGEAEGLAAGLHVFDRDSGDWNLPAVKHRFTGHAVVLVEWAWRERGLIVAPGNPKKIGGVGDLAGCRVVPRQAEAGSQVLLEHLLQEAGLTAQALQFVHPARTESDAALAVQEGQADAAFGLLSVARQLRLEFLPVIRERFDLLVWRGEWFEAPFQKFLALSDERAFKERADALAGYDVSGLGRVHFNGK